MTTENEQMVPAPLGPVERPVGRPVPERAGGCGRDGCRQINGDDFRNDARAALEAALGITAAPTGGAA